jgi:glycosyltransferase involved in cell wall biosynthesis
VPPPQTPNSDRATRKQESTPARLKLAIVAPSFRFVGGQSVQGELLFRLWQGDADVEAIFVAVDPPIPDWIAWAQQVRGLRTVLRFPFYMADLWKGMADADVVHIFASSYWSFLIAAAPAWLIAKLRSKKTLMHYHNGDGRDHLRRFRSAKFALSHVDEIVVPTRYLVDVMREFDLRPVVVPNLVDLSQFRYRERRPLRPRLICSRGFNHYYKIDVVVRAYAEVKRVYPDATLDLLGHGHLETEIRKLVAELKLSDVRFPGVISRQQIGEYYDRADIFINASCVDAMPVSVIEAFRAGTPVVSTSPEAMPYLVEHERTGLLCEVGDHNALAANVVRLLEDEQQASKLAENAYQETLRYEWGIVREQWLNVYRAILDSRVSPIGAESTSVRDIS